MSPRSSLARADLDADAELIAHLGGNALMARTIRYIEERRHHQDRYTDAIEAHPSPLTIVWGTDDSIAVPAMADRLAAARPDAALRWLDGVGHYPMLEAPDAFAAAIGTAL